MGADLCGYMLFGPLSIGQDKVDEAVKYVMGVGQSLKDLPWPARAKPQPEDDIDAIIAALPDSVGVFRDYASSAGVCNPDGYQELFSKIEAYAEPDNAKAFVTEFVGLWNDEGYRDMSARNVPGRDEKCLFCGEMSSGDGPEPDSAWYICEQASRIGLFGYLGIE